MRGRWPWGYGSILSIIIISKEYIELFNDGPKGPKLSWDYMSKMSKCFGVCEQNEIVIYQRNMLTKYNCS